MPNLEELCKTNLDRRDQAWEKDFHEALKTAQLGVVDSAPQNGPDGWPYLFTKTGPKATEPAEKVISWLAQYGVGLVVNPKDCGPDYVFSYGMLWNFIERGEFITESPHVKPGAVNFEKGQKVLAGPPSEDYLPLYVRGILNQFFKDQGIQEIKVLVMGSEDSHFDLCFSLESLGHPPQSEHRGIAEAISWFLPGHYSIMLASEKDLPPFHSLQ